MIPTTYKLPDIAHSLRTLSEQLSIAANTITTLELSTKSIVEDIYCNTDKELLQKISHFEQERKHFLEEKESFLSLRHAVALAANSTLHKVRLNIGGTLFVTARETLLGGEQCSFFSVMLGSPELWHPDDDGEYFIDRDPTFFPRILNFLRSGEWNLGGLTRNDVGFLRVELDFYRIDERSTIVEAELSYFGKEGGSSSGGVKGRGYVAGGDVVIVFGKGVGTASTDTEKDSLNANNLVVFNESGNLHWNSGKVDKASVWCNLSGPSKVTQIQVAVRCSAHVTVMGGKSKYDMPTCLVKRIATGLKDQDGMSKDRVMVFDINCEEVVELIRIDCEKGGNVSLFWVVVLGKK